MGGISLTEGAIAEKKKKRAMRLRDKAPIGREQAEFTHGETTVRRLKDYVRKMQESANRETPTTLARVSGG